LDTVIVAQFLIALSFKQAHVIVWIEAVGIVGEGFLEVLLSLDGFTRPFLNNSQIVVDPHLVNERVFQLAQSLNSFIPFAQFFKSNGVVGGGLHVGD